MELFVLRYLEKPEALTTFGRIKLTTKSRS
jgi:hypothetical protein